jgi:hypothetical protein
MLGMAHPEFSSMFDRRENAQRFAENQVADYGRKDANTSALLFSTCVRRAETRDQETF